MFVFQADTVRKLLVGTVDVYRQSPQEVRQIKNRP
jgi:hypothetical protein